MIKNTFKSKSFHLRVPLLIKVIFVLTLGFSVKLFVSCFPPNTIDMHFNKIEIYGIDNSGIRACGHMVDTMYASAVAFKLNLMDTTQGYYSHKSNYALSSLSFAPAMAFTVDRRFIPVNKVAQIKITTLLDIDENIKAGEDITNLILFGGDNFELYHNVNSAISTLNKEQSAANSSIVMVLSISAKNPTLQLNVQVTLDNNSVLSADTDVITILNPPEL
ncbi:MAG TPA: hypothetical protein PLY32_03390 [Salinivirgaceae bacterium]|nr:hypothetical protein [Salinivirgaceae bacterium]HQA76143.1 hypothetical protein [Salinivirgaceae bacterium]